MYFVRLIGLAYLQACKMRVLLENLLENPLENPFFYLIYKIARNYITEGAENKRLFGNLFYLALLRGILLALLFCLWLFCFCGLDFVRARF